MHAHIHMCIYVSVCQWVGICKCECKLHEAQKTEPDLLELECQGILSNLMWVAPAMILKVVWLPSERVV